MRIDELIAAEAKASEQNKDAELKPGTKTTRGHGRSKTLQVRLNDDEFAVLARVAEERGIPVSTLARDLLLRELGGHNTDPRSLLARIRSDLDELAARVA
ncbi:hypothetical protein [Luteococcus japonicus]|uniref:Uncharacterized protein n=1 Tax=Luteococcus japonicus LSP_Lj1 TaxID=1255658 RepID=A0A1R4K001_9ACTN|nr:hypothetical protein [Luteococcus japonicus]SJN37484.1 hypothetical protein FM114_10535 [Luteococcus japonicus LSP_Lj1]